VSNFPPPKSTTLSRRCPSISRSSRGIWCPLLGGRVVVVVVWRRGRTKYPVVRFSSGGWWVEGEALKRSTRWWSSPVGIGGRCSILISESAGPYAHDPRRESGHTNHSGRGTSAQILAFLCGCRRRLADLCSNNIFFCALYGRLVRPSHAHPPKNP